MRPPSIGTRWSKVCSARVRRWPVWQFGRPLSIVERPSTQLDQLVVRGKHEHFTPGFVYLIDVRSVDDLETA